LNEQSHPNTKTYSSENSLPEIHRALVARQSTKGKECRKAVTWRDLVKPYMSPDNKRSIWQITNTILPLMAMYVLMYQSLTYSYWLTLALALPTAGLMVRVFIIMHDCGHGSFFKSPKANHWVGTITGILVNTPYFQWTREHAIHHATSGDLDRRGVGDALARITSFCLMFVLWGKTQARASGRGYT
jgi:fatty acid desaturase